MVDRHDDELAERRASGGRPQPGMEAPGATAGPASTAGGALPLPWADPSGDPDGGEPIAEVGATIDLTERTGRDDFEVWSDVLRRRPVEAARLTGHPSAAGERLEPAGSRGREDDDEFARALLDRRRRRGRGRAGDPGGEGRPSGGEGGEGPPGPSPGNVSRLRPVWPEPEGSDGPKGFGADLATRVVTGVVVAAACLLAFNAGRGPTAWLLAALVGLGVLELCTALRSLGYRPAVIIALVGSVSLVLGAYTSGQSAFPLVGFVVAVTTLLWYLARVVRGRPAMGAATTFLAFGYVGVLGGFAGLLLGFENGVGMLIGLAVCTVSHDVCGYLAGSRFGKRRIAPRISPNKTLEGLLAGMAGSVVFAVVVTGVIAPWDRLSALALGALVAVLAPLGDLCESMLKRDLGLKDIGGMLPGHGGVLDRFDAILFCLPAVYYLVRVLELS